MLWTSILVDAERPSLVWNCCSHCAAHYPLYPCQNSDHKLKLNQEVKKIWHADKKKVTGKAGQEFYSKENNAPPQITNIKIWCEWKISNTCILCFCAFLYNFRFLFKFLLKKFSSFSNWQCFLTLWLLCLFASFLKLQHVELSYPSYLMVFNEIQLVYMLHSRDRYSRTKYCFGNSVNNKNNVWGIAIQLNEGD